MTKTKPQDVAARWTPIGDLTPAKRNPRKNDRAVDPVARSIATLGFGAPLVVDQRGEVIAGHTRLRAAQELGRLLAEEPGLAESWHPDAVRVARERTVPVRAVDVTPEQARAMRIADNKLGEIAEWEPALLDLELQELPADMVEVVGFEVTTVGEHDRIDAAPDQSEEAKTDFALLITCRDEAHQREMIEWAEKEGLEYKALT